MPTTEKQKAAKALYRRGTGTGEPDERDAPFELERSASKLNYHDDEGVLIAIRYCTALFSQILLLVWDASCLATECSSA